MGRPKKEKVNVTENDIFVIERLKEIRNGHSISTAVDAILQCLGDSIDSNVINSKVASQFIIQIVLQYFGTNENSDIALMSLGLLRGYEEISKANLRRIKYF